MRVDFLNTLSVAGDLAGGAQCLFLLLFLISRPAGRSSANMMLAAATFVLGLCLIDDFLGAQRFAPGIEYIGNVFPCLIGPLVYLHVEAQVAPGQWRIERRHWRHGICFVVLSSFLLLALAFPFPHELSSGKMTPAVLPRLLFAVASTLGAYLISLHHGLVFQRTPEMMVNDIVAPLKKYRKSAQTAEDAERLIVKIEAVFARNRLFRDSSLSLASLAQSIGARPNAVSQAINQYLGLSYFDFVNRSRCLRRFPRSCPPVPRRS